MIECLLLRTSVLRLLSFESFRNKKSPIIGLLLRTSVLRLLSFESFRNKKSPIIGYEPKLSFFTFKPSERLESRQPFKTRDLLRYFCVGW